jgi:hypothetical protein
VIVRKDETVAAPTESGLSRVGSGRDSNLGTFRM